MTGDRPRRVIVWRHGETAHNRDGVYQGQLDAPLSDTGRAQAAAAAEALAARRPTRLLSSDLSRAADTAAALAGLTGLRIEPDERLREIHVGAWAGLSHQQVTHDYPDLAGAIARGEDLPRGGSGERVADVAVRARASFEELLTTLEPGATAVLATHGVASRALVADVVGLTYDQAWNALIGLRNCHWAELVEHRVGWRLDSWNVGVTASVGSVTDR